MKCERVIGNQRSSQLLYFTSPSLTKNDDGLVFISDCDGSPNIFYKDLKTFQERQLTFISDGYLESYIYYEGNQEKGLGKASICFDNENNLIYYIHNKKICCVDLEGNSRIVSELPPDQVTAYTHISYDGTRLCVPTTDQEAFLRDQWN